ncbi:hypothetical protein Pan216_04390 [Planctomycetes bacterium Pan216]|uniref:Uncharacterized protein n=2 Tax=Kolteria novifilia TaxID=2527975 RepID=A0A518AY01_9BACT|nr:hypothetical protein Pan216_04390 [Planctomycetes bacterium Pan216]
MKEGFDFIALDELDEASFRAFCRGCRAAFDECQSKQLVQPPELFSGVMDRWREFMTMLEADDRFDDASLNN